MHTVTGNVNITCISYKRFSKVNAACYHRAQSSIRTFRQPRYFAIRCFLMSCAPNRSQKSRDKLNLTKYKTFSCKHVYLALFLQSFYFISRSASLFCFLDLCFNGKGISGPHTKKTNQSAYWTNEWMTTSPDCLKDASFPVPDFDVAMAHPPFLSKFGEYCSC